MYNEQLKEQSMLYLLSQNNFIVPEIQREYVWGNNPDVLNRFLDSIAEKTGEFCKCCRKPITRNKINVGFLYTYKPSYVTYQYERYLDENLIDGQQRFTTLILLLFYFSLVENKQDEFSEALRIKEDLEMAFDYKVRNVTHMFLLQLVNKVKSIDNLLQTINYENTWFLEDFKNDLTVKAMINTLRIIHEKFFKQQEFYFDFILHNVKFYHFRTEATNQGEELYITMNARGEPLSKNEENKAALMINDEFLFENGRKWEELQDFFWRYRNRDTPNTNADAGFNEFLRWIQIIEMSISDGELDVEEDERISDNSITNKIVTLIQGEHIQLDKTYFPIEKIEKYFNALKFLYEDYLKLEPALKCQYPNVKRLDFLKFSYLHPESTIEQSLVFQFLPVLYYTHFQLDRNLEPDKQNIFRLFRFLRNLREDITVRKTINKQVINAINLVKILLESDDLGDIAKISNLDNRGISRTLKTSEENFKLRLYLSNSEDRTKIENKIWESEDNEILKGKVAPLLQYSYIDAENDGFTFSKSFAGYDVQKFNLANFSSLLENFYKLTNRKTFISNDIWGSLILTDYYKLNNYNDKHKIITCKNASDSELIKDNVFLKKLREVENFENTEYYFEQIYADATADYESIDDIKDETDFKKQLYLYFYVLNKKSKWGYSSGKNFGIYLEPENFTSFFNTNVRFQHYNVRWFGADYHYFKEDSSVLENYFINQLKN